MGGDISSHRVRSGMFGKIHHHHKDDSINDVVGCITRIFCAGCLILLSGDVETNPGPMHRTWGACKKHKLDVDGIKNGHFNKIYQLKIEDLTNALVYELDMLIRPKALARCLATVYKSVYSEDFRKAAHYYISRVRKKRNKLISSATQFNFNSFLAKPFVFRCRRSSLPIENSTAALQISTIRDTATTNTSIFTESHPSPIQVDHTYMHIPPCTEDTITPTVHTDHTYMHIPPCTEDTTTPAVHTDHTYRHIPPHTQDNPTPSLHTDNTYIPPHTKDAAKPSLHTNVTFTPHAQSATVPTLHRDTSYRHRHIPPNTPRFSYAQNMAHYRKTLKILNRKYIRLESANRRRIEIIKNFKPKIRRTKSTQTDFEKPPETIRTKKNKIYTPEFFKCVSLLLREGVGHNHVSNVIKAVMNFCKLEPSHLPAQSTVTNMSNLSRRKAKSPKIKSPPKVTICTDETLMKENTTTAVMNFCNLELSDLPVQSTVMNMSNLSRPKAKSPKIKTPKIKTSKIKTPKIKTHKIKTPKIKTPKIKTLKIKTPKIKTPKIKTLKIKTPKINTPKINSPKINSPPNIIICTDETLMEENIVAITYLQ